MFGTKEALLTALVAGAQQRVAPPQGLGPGLGRLRQRAARYLDQISAGDEHARAFLLLWAESVGATPHLRAMFAERDNLFAREIREDLTAGIADGDIRPGIDTEGTALALIAALRGASLHAISRGRHLTPPRACATSSSPVCGGAWRTHDPGKARTV